MKKISNIHVAYKCIMAICLLSLLGCSMPCETFDCKYEKGVGCRSITQVNNMVNRGEIKGIPDEDSSCQRSTPPQDLCAASMIERVNEKHLRVWLSPFQDEQGNFHEASIVHTVLRPGHWEWRQGA